MGIQNFNVNKENAGKIYQAAEKLQALLQASPENASRPFTANYKDKEANALVNGNTSLFNLALFEVDGNFTEEELSSYLNDKYGNKDTIDRAVTELLYTLVDTDGDGDITNAEWDAFDADSADSRISNRQIGNKELNNLGLSLDKIMSACKEYDTSYIPEQYADIKAKEEAAQIEAEIKEEETKQTIDSLNETALAVAMESAFSGKDPEAAALLINANGGTLDDFYIQSFVEEYGDNKNFVLTNEDLENDLLTRALAGDVDAANILINNYHYDSSNSNYRQIIKLFKNNESFVKYRK